MTTILYVDDIAILTQLYSKGLTEAGFNMITATSGSECLTILENTKPDLIILDIMMEPMDGWNVLSHVRKLDPKHTILVVMLTAKALSPDDIREYGDLFDGYIMKPLTIEKLLKHVRWYCEKLQEIDHAITMTADSKEDPDAIRAYYILLLRIHNWEALIQTYKKRLATPDTSYQGMDDFESEIEKLEEQVKILKKQLTNGSVQV